MSKMKTQRRRYLDGHLETDAEKLTRERKNENNRRYREKHRERLNRERNERREENGRNDADSQRESRRGKKLGLPPPVRVLKGIDKEAALATKRRRYAATAESYNKVKAIWRDANRAKVNGYAKTWRKKHQGTGDAVDLATLLRARLKSIRRVGGSKFGKSGRYLGCSYAQWMEHLGSDHKRIKELDLHIDHIWPISRYDLTNPNEQLKAFNWRNTRLCPSKSNRQKKDKVPDKALAYTVHPGWWPLGYADYFD